MTKILNQHPHQNAQQFVALYERLFEDRYARHPNKNPEENLEPLGSIYGLRHPTRSRRREAFSAPLGAFLFSALSHFPDEHRDVIFSGLQKQTVETLGRIFH